MEVTVASKRTKDLIATGTSPDGHLKGGEKQTLCGVP
jgi:hypothetical protein